MTRVSSWQFLLAALVGTVVYALLSVTVGRDGVWCYKQLEEQRRAISSRAASIQKINDELNKERMALERDKSVIAAYAHRLEYVKDNEKLIKITGLKPYESILYDTGTPLRHHDIKCMSEGACKAAGFVFFILVSLIMLLYDLASGSIEREEGEANKAFIDDFIGTSSTGAAAARSTATARSTVAAMSADRSSASQAAAYGSADGADGVIDDYVAQG